MFLSSRKPITVSFNLVDADIIHGKLLLNGFKEIKGVTCACNYKGRAFMLFSLCWWLAYLCQVSRRLKWSFKSDEFSVWGKWIKWHTFIVKCEIYLERWVPL